MPMHTRRMAQALSKARVRSKRLDRHAILDQLASGQIQTNAEFLREHPEYKPVSSVMLGVVESCSDFVPPAGRLTTYYDARDHFLKRRCECLFHLRKRLAVLNEPFSRRHQHRIAELEP